MDIQDEAVLYISRRVNHQWGSENPHIIQEIKRWCKGEYLVCFGMFRGFGARFLCGINSDSYDLPAHAIVVSVNPAGRSSEKCGAPARW
jgi:hypothetical protein